MSLWEKLPPATHPLTPQPRVTWLSPAMPTAVRGPGPLDRDHLSPKEKWYLPTWFALLSTEPYKDLRPPFSSETPHPWAQPFPPHLHKLSHNWKVPAALKGAFLMVWKRKEPLQRPQGITSRDGKRTPQARPTPP